MSDVISSPTAEVDRNARIEHASFLSCWRGVQSSAQEIAQILDSVNHPRDLTDEQKFKLQWELEYMLHFVRDEAFSGMFLSESEFERHLNLYMKSLGA